MVGKCLGTYLECICGEQHTKWSECLALAERWYIMELHTIPKQSSIRVVVWMAIPLPIQQSCSGEF